MLRLVLHVEEPGQLAHFDIETARWVDIKSDRKVSSEHGQTSKAKS